MSPFDFEDPYNVASDIPPAVTSLDDGSLQIDFDPAPPMEEPTIQDTFHNDNLADKIEPQKLKDIIGSLIDAVESDYESAEAWRILLKNGIEYMGINDKEQNWPFEKTPMVTATAYKEAVYGFVSNARAELLPPSGPARIEIVAQETPELLQQSDRVEKYMNLWCTDMAPEYYPEWDQVFMWSAIEGSVFKKTYFDSNKGRPVSPFIRPDDFIVNYNATSLETASRITQLLKLNFKELKQDQLSGKYLDLDVSPMAGPNNDNVVESKLDQMQGFQNTSYDHNKIYELYECHVDLDLGEHVDENGQTTGLPVPYIVTIDVESRICLGFYRNWEEGDPTYKRIEWFTQVGPFLPGFGFYGFGLAHVAGGLAKTSTEMLRQIIIAGTLASFPGGIRVKGLQFEDNNIRLGPGEWPEVETGGLSIKDAISPLPYSYADPSYIQLQKDLEGIIKELAGVINQPLADFNPNAPVGTTLALLEQSGRMQSSIMRRMHSSLKNELKLLFNLFGQYLPDAPYPYDTGGQQPSIMRQDFAPTLNIIPVSDPNICSSAQRLIRAEAILRMAQQAPELHNMRDAYERVYREMKVPNIDALLPVPQQAPPPPTDLVSTMMAIMQGQPVQAQVWQDHDAYIMAVDAWVMQNPQNPNIPAAMAYRANHEAFKYMIEMYQAIGMQPPTDPSQIPPEQQNQIAAAVAQASQELAQQSQGAGQPGPIDPSIVGLEEVKVNAAANEMRYEIDKDRIELDRHKIELEHESKEQQIEKDLMVAQLKAEVDSKNAELKVQADAYKAALDAMIKGQTTHPDVTLQKDVPID